jgi:hypothetical protein
MVSKAQLKSIPEEPCGGACEEAHHLSSPVKDPYASMQNPSGSETPDNPAKPFHDAAYRRWEQEFERDPAKKPLPPLPRVPLPVQQSGDRFVGRLPEKREEHASSPVRQPHPTVFKSQRNDLVSVEDGLFPPPQMNSEWERRAQRMALRERVMQEDPHFKSSWTPISANMTEDRKRCCIVM